ncbi:acriflavin resistance protein [Pseudoalteromonas luteoviolacea]|uniref:Acriflavin resistance protein n=1 Tax=Pseudoalteromonas luteoviolacea TaxID=43657 RepID=A0A1C0TSD0_9GAMM|nr:efflux RND transporter permease subunit [Pseudoalteromonas luteoviolacea]MBQ4810810.1 efflux RND transporter permease subunit [Pseudoalteromonas luteoviolacea]OCQ22151.1 acriflavin resistance protein [Pseudoalteromonas luteoviolacea]
MISYLLNNARFQALLVALLLVSGFAALNSLPRTEDPRINNRFAFVTTYLPGASAARVEAQITEKIEQKLKQQSEIKTLVGMSRSGISVLSIELGDDITNSLPVWSRLRDLLADVQIELPQEASSPLLEDDRGYAYTKIVALTIEPEEAGSMSLQQAKQVAVNRYTKELRNRLRNQSGVEVVHLFGVADEEIRITLEPAKLKLAGLSFEQVAQAIKNADAKVAAGILSNQQIQMQVELSGEFTSVQRIAAIPIQSDVHFGQVLLRDIATIERTLVDPQPEIAWIDGMPGAYLGIRMLPDVRIDKFSDQIDEELTKFSQTLPNNIQLHSLFDQKGYTEERLGGLLNNILVGFGLILAVLFLTLGLRAALIVGLALPLTVMFTLACMNIYGLPIHQISVTGLVVALGIMVDNAIVITDAVQRYRQQGMKALEAVTKAVNHFWMPLMSSTLTTILAFMPIVLMPGPSGEFVGGIALSVIFALIGSYLISHTLIAVFAGKYVIVGDTKDHGLLAQGLTISKLSSGFENILKRALKRPLVTIVGVMVLPVLGFISAGQLTEQFFPPADRDMFHIEVRLSDNASIQATKRLVEKMEQQILKHEGIERLDWMVGRNIPIFYYNLLQRDKGARNYAQAMVKVTDFERANELIKTLQIELDRAFPEAQTLVRKLEQGPPFNAPIEIRIFGPELNQLSEIGKKVKQTVIAHPDVTHTRTTLQSGAAKVEVLALESQLTHAGAQAQRVAAQLQAQSQGVDVASVLEGTETVPVRVRFDDHYRADLDGLADVEVMGSQPLLLSAFATSRIVPEQSTIHRRNGERVNVVEAFLRTDVLPAKVLKDIQQQLELSQLSLPVGYRLEIGGESQQRDQAVGSLLGKVGVIFVLLITVLVLTFNSFTTTGLILITAFQSAMLGILSVYIAGHPFGFTVIIGLLGLMGLAINAAIVILSELRANDATEMEEIVTSVMTCARHITSTTITTVGGFLPLILAGGSFWPPFAIAIAGGTVLTTVLSFFFVPSCYWLMKKRKACSGLNKLRRAD